MPTENKAYYRGRALEERERAAAASEPSIAAIHSDLAAKYEALAKEGGAKPTLRPKWDGMSNARTA